MIDTPEASVQLDEADQKKLELASNRLKAVQEEVLAKTKEVADLETELGGARKARENAFAQKADMERQAFDMEQCRDELKEEVSRLQTTLAAHEKEHEDRRAHHASMDASLEERKDAVSQKETELSERVSEHDKKEKEVEERRAAVESARAKFSDAIASVTW